MEYEVPRCPICLVKQTEHTSLVNAALAVSYCPACGIPHFMESGNVPERVECQVCGKRFKPEDGGGATLRYNLGGVEPFQTPTGIKHFTLTRG
jgi:hypothetical protein